MAEQVLITSSSSENKHGQIGFLPAAAAAAGILSLTAACGARGFAYWLVCLCCFRLAKYCSSHRTMLTNQKAKLIVTLVVCGIKQQKPAECFFFLCVFARLKKYLKKQKIKKILPGTRSDCGAANGSFCEQPGQDSCSLNCLQILKPSSASSEHAGSQISGFQIAANL